METDQSILTPSANGVNKNSSVFRNSFSEAENEIEEIISNKPPYVVRWGTVYFFVLLLALGIISWYIQYPDIVIATAKLNGVNIPQQVIARADGKLLKIAVEENEKVDKDQILGYIESIANPQSIHTIARQTDSIGYLIAANRSDEVVHFFPGYKNQKSIGDLGELQSAYQVFMQSFIAYKDYLHNGFYLRKKNMLQTDMGNIQNLHDILIYQKKLMEEDVSLSKKTLDVNKSLSDQKVISALDFRIEKSKLIAKQLSLPQINASIVSNEREQNEKQKEIAELENQITIQKNTFLQALQTIKSQVQAWEYKYALKAPVSGTASFTGFLQENQEMKAGQLLFHVQPGNTSYFVEMLIPQYNFGKVKQGQKVLLKFQAYPFEQYGPVVGKIDYIKTTPTDSGYLARVELPNALLTNYGKRLQYRNGLLAQADIITEDVRLLERFYYKMIRNLSDSR